MMKDIYVLGIESSCDETSCSIVKNGIEEKATVISSQIDIHSDFGGVVPEIASRQHVKNITMVIEETLRKVAMTMDEIDAIGLTYGPGLIGSLLIGIEAAKTLAFAHGKPLVPIHHITGHIYSNNLVKELEFPLLALIISGGHTDLIYMPDRFTFNKLGGTLDDAVGECYDKVARVVGVGYPGGPIIDKLAQEGKANYDLPMPMNDGSYNFSFSGLKSAVINLNHKEKQKGKELIKEDLAKSFQDVVVETLAIKTAKALDEQKIKRFIIAGGVAANSDIRKKMQSLADERGIEFICPPLRNCTDNAAMIASAAYYYFKEGKTSSYDIEAKSSDTIK